jgi:4-diphosphocytidyl-2-C-methyl-D-erythritol kinase
LPQSRHRRLSVRAHAKLNLTLRVLGVRADGYHELRTVFQSLALHDTLTVIAGPGPFSIQCDDPACPRDRSNLIWQAAERLWRRGGRRSRISGVQVELTKRIPMQAGLGGGSSDAAAALSGLAAVWRLPLNREELAGIGRELGADVPFFFRGGTALGLERGDLIFPLPDCRPSWVVLAMPGFGVSTRDAYAWWDAAARTPAQPRRRLRPSGPAGPTGPAAILDLPAAEMVNDLEGPVVANHPAIGRLIAQLRRFGAAHAAMSGSGSAVFGLFTTRAEASLAATALRQLGVTVLVTRTLGRAGYGRSAAPFT